VSAGLCAPLQAHRETLPAAPQEQRQADASRLPPAADDGISAVLRLQWTDERGGLVRISPQAGGEWLPLPGMFERPAGWHSMPARGEVRLPPGRYLVEATRGMDSLVDRKRIEVERALTAEVALEARRFYEPAARNLRAVNTHLHLLLRARLKMGVDLASRADADAYLRTVAETDGLDLVYVSYLTQPGQAVVSNDYTADDLRAFSGGATEFADGIEHRHGGVRIKVPLPPAPGPGEKPVYSRDDSQVAMTYGHALLLGLDRHRVPASLGPGLSSLPEATDGTPLREGMRVARDEGGAVVWCHGSYGVEWIPSWTGGLLDGQNIYDGSTEGTFETVYYPLLNAGLRVPFSAGSDWGVWDFSRVLVASAEPLNHAAFRRELAAGRTYITNEPFLEFTAGDVPAGDTVAMAAGRRVRVRGRAVGRSDFVRLQVVHDGTVAHEVPCRAVDGHFEAAIDHDFEVTKSGWVALRIPPETPYSIRARVTGRGVNILAKPIFAHTSPVYLSVDGRPAFDPAAVELLISRVRAALAAIDQYGRFADGAEREEIRRIYTEAEAVLRDRLAGETRR
jgi:hypothetical protein